MKQIFLILGVFVFSIGNPVYAGGNLPDAVLAQQPVLHPEGIEWDQDNHRFLVGSVTLGGVFSVADNGTVTPFSQHTTLAPSSIGIHIDKGSDRLLVAYANPNIVFDPTLPVFAELGIYDLNTGAELNLVNLKGMLGEGVPQLPNDVTNDSEGNVYVTDWTAPIIYKIDTNGNASVFLTFADPTLRPNGIDFHPDGYLIVALPLTASLVKVPLDNPVNYTVVNTGQPISIDGMAFTKKNDLVGVANTYDANGEPVGEVLVLHSADHWASAEIVSRGVANQEKTPTTVTLRNKTYFTKEAYVVHPDYNGLTDYLNGGPPVLEFEILRIDGLELNGYITICHNNTHTMKVSLFSWDTFYKPNGDTIGACP